MKAVRTNLKDGIDGLVVRELKSPDPGPRQVKIRVRAASLNYRDLLLVRGQYGAETAQRELTPLTDGAGQVIAVGPGVTRVIVGDRVSCSNIVRWISGPWLPEYRASQPGITLDGMLAEEITVDDDGVVLLPAYLSYEEAASLPCAAVTAWHALVEGGSRLLPGQTVLVLGTGGVSLFALQFAKLMGLKVIATTSSDAKAEELVTRGADAVVNYARSANWDVEVRKLTGGVGVHRVIEVGGSTIAKSVASCAFGGHISQIGYLAAGESSLSAWNILRAGLSIQAVAIGSRVHFEQLLDAMNNSRIRPVIDRVFSFEDHKHAFQHFSDGTRFGKTVISL